MSARLEALKQNLIRELEQAKLDLLVAEETARCLKKDIEDLTRDVTALENLGYV